VRRRLMLAFVGLVLGVLVIAGAGSIILTDNAARTQAIQQLLTEAKSLTGQPERPKALEQVHRVLKLEDAEVLHITVGVGSSGNTSRPDGGGPDAPEPPRWRQCLG